MNNSFEKIYNKHKSPSIYLLRKRGCSANLAKDIYQEAMIVLWNKLNDNNFVLTSKISTFIHGCCKMLWLKEIEQRKKIAPDIEPPEDSSIQYSTFDQDFEDEIVQQEIQKLRQPEQDVLNLFLFEKMTMQSISEQLGAKNASVIKTRKYKAIKNLSKSINKKYKKSDFQTT